MPIAAYIFIETVQGKSKAVATEVSKIAGIKTAHTVTGPYDIITFAEVDSIKTLGDSVVSRIQTISGVLRTLTNVVIDLP